MGAVARCTSATACAPLILFWKKARTNPVVAVRGVDPRPHRHVVRALQHHRARRSAHDFYPYTWGIYVPTLTDSTIVIGSFAWFFLLFLGFIKLMPSLSIVEVKETLPPPMKDARAWRPPLRRSLGVFAHVDTTVRALEELRGQGLPRPHGLHARCPCTRSRTCWSAIAR